MSTVIAVDAMGGDRAPGAAVEGAVLAVARTSIGVLLVGPEAILDAELARYDSGGPRLHSCARRAGRRGHARVAAACPAA